MKNQKFQPGSFIEVDDLYAGRKIVMVGKDGVTFWDSAKTELCAPLVVHPVFRPELLGTTIEFVRSNGLLEGVRKLLSRLRDKMDHRIEDSLFQMRVLWYLAKQKPETGGRWVPDDAQVALAIHSAEEQEQLALRVHEQAKQFQKLAA